MGQQNRVVTVWAGGHHVDRHASGGGNPIEVMLRSLGELVVIGHAHSAVRPAWEGFVNGCATRNLVCAHGQDVDFFAVQLVAHAQEQLGQTVKHV